MGVGLTLVKQLVELHGGSITARSEGHGKGTEFVVRIPQYQGERTELPVDALTTQAEHAGRILIVEDNLDSRETLKSLLEIYGYEVEVAADGRTGLDLVQNCEFNLALVDIGLPGIDGYEVARSIRCDAKHDNVRLVALTGYGSDADRMAVREAGFDDHLVKPLTREELDKVLPRRE